MVINAKCVDYLLINMLMLCCVCIISRWINVYTHWFTRDGCEQRTERDVFFICISHCYFEFHFTMTEAILEN